MNPKYNSVQKPKPKRDRSTTPNGATHTPNSNNTNYQPQKVQYFAQNSQPQLRIIKVNEPHYQIAPEENPNYFHQVKIIPADTYIPNQNYILQKQEEYYEEDDNRNNQLLFLTDKNVKHYKIVPFTIPENGIPEDNISKNDLKTAENLMCPVCLGLVWDPIKCRNCDQIFCKTCLVKILNKTGLCPMRCHFLALEIDRIVKNILDNIEVKCLNKDCKERMHYSQLQSHYFECKHSLYMCLNQGCTFQGKKKEIEKHEADCEFKRIYCEYCNGVIRVLDKKSHIEIFCPNVDVLCPQCGQIFKRKFYLEKHFSDYNSNVNCLQKQVENLKKENKRLKKYISKITEQSLETLEDLYADDEEVKDSSAAKTENESAIKNVSEPEKKEVQPFDENDKKK